MKILRLAPVLLGLWAMPSHAQINGPSCGSPQNPCVTTGSGSGGTPTPVVPGLLTYLGKQTLTAATLASSTVLTVPAGATVADFYPECSSAGTDNQCVRYDPATTANNATSAGWASQQNTYGWSGPLATTQVILAAGATGATGNTLTVLYYK